MRSLRATTLLLLTLALLTGAAGCRQKTVTVRSGEIVLCTQGEVVSDTTEELEVPEDEVGEYAVTTRVVTCDLHSKLEALYAQAQKAISDGDMDAAAKALAEVLDLDPTYRDARSQLNDIDAGKTPAPGSSTSGGAIVPGDSNTPGGDAPTGPSLNLVDYMPDRITGFVGQGLIADPLVLTRDYLPETPGAIIKLVIVAEQFKDAAGAKAEATSTLKNTYPTDWSQISIDGRTAYFGSNRSVAIVAFVDGAILVAVEGAASSGEGAALKSRLIDLAEEVAR